jgi:ABC-2 type transport system permease protein
LLKAVVIAVKDLRQRIRDRSAFVTSIVAPLGLAAILGALLPSEEVELSRYAVVNLDLGPVAQVFVDQVVGPLERDRSAFRFVVASSEEEAITMARDARIDAAFVIPEGFSEAAANGRPAQIRVIGNSEAPIGTQIAEAIAKGFVSELNSARIAVATLQAVGGRPPDPGDLEQLARRAAAVPSPVEVREDPAASRDLAGSTFFAAGMAVFFLFFTAQFGVLSLLGERREGTLARLLAAPISPGAIIGGKALSTFVLGAVSMTVLVVASAFLLDARWGDPVGVALLVLAGVFAAVGLTSLVAGLARTDEQAAGYGSIMAVTLGILGGTFFPLSQGPAFINQISLFTPHAWLMRGFADLSTGSPAGDVLPSIGVLLTWAAIAGALALLQAQRVVRRR